MDDPVTLTAREVISLLDLKPHGLEGGYFKETYRHEAFLGGPRGSRSLATAIYYMITDSSFSLVHRLSSDEMFHFYAGDPVEMLQLREGGAGSVIAMGSRLEAGRLPQVLIPAGVWQGCRLAPGGSWALLGTTVSPGFSYEDYEPGRRDDLCRSHPAFREWIEALTPPGGRP